jgi:nucleoside-diphosphate kinase
MHNERTFVIIKPDGIQRSLVGEIIKRFERTGLKIVGMKFGMLDSKKIWEHYNKDDAWFVKKGAKIAEDRKANGLSADKEPIEYGKDIIRALEKFMTSGPVVSMVLQGSEGPVDREGGSPRGWRLDRSRRARARAEYARRADSVGRIQL